MGDRGLRGFYQQNPLGQCGQHINKFAPFDTILRITSDFAKASTDTQGERRTQHLSRMLQIIELLRILNKALMHEIGKILFDTPLFARDHTDKLIKRKFAILRKRA
jgi:hypothetical protein